MCSYWLYIDQSQSTARIHLTYLLRRWRSFLHNTRSHARSIRLRILPLTVSGSKRKRVTLNKSVNHYSVVSMIPCGVMFDTAFIYLLHSFSFIFSKIQGTSLSIDGRKIPAAMYLSQMPTLASSLLFLLSHVIATSANTELFAELSASLGNLGYHGKAATIFGALNHSTAANALGAGGPCTKTVRSYTSLNLLFPSQAMG